MRIASTWSVVCALTACALELAGCVAPRAERAVDPSATTAPAAPQRTLAPLRAIRVVAVEDDTPAGGDGAPRMTLAFELADGSSVAIEGQATAYARFRDGVALVDRQRRLLLVTPDGARSVLAQHSGAPPAQGPTGALAYVARYGLVAEVHLLDVDGRDRIVATDLADAGVLAPQRDGSVLFVGARAGGVAGAWRASLDGQPARCLTNCELRTGTEWGGRFVPPPGDTEQLVQQVQRAQLLDPTLPSSTATGATR